MTKQSTSFRVGLLPNEIIKPIPGFEGRYSVTSFGRVFSHLYRHRIFTSELSVFTHPEGYKVAKVAGINSRSPTKVHRLVALAFHPNPNNLPQVNHKDGDKGNNHYMNLEWVDNSANQKHAFDSGLQHREHGEKHHMAVLSEKDVIEIREKLREKTYKGQLDELAFKYGVSKHCIFDIKHRRSWVHV